MRIRHDSFVPTAFHATAGVLLVGLSVVAPTRADAAVVDGVSTAWHPLQLSFTGPHAGETDATPNPFLDYRLQATLIAPSGRQSVVPGFFDGDGQGGGRGDIWRVRFAPDEPGRWRYRASLRKGTRVAIDLDPDAGEPAALDGASGTFTVSPRDANAPGFLKWGRLRYVGGHYLKFADGPYWLRGGTDSPENFLAYDGFDNTPASHDYDVHRTDWRPGDPDWADGRGRGIIGALNALASRHANSVYFLTMNIGGDGDDVWPWVGRPRPGGSPTNDNVHYDISKLRQWNTVFEHAQRRGIFLHFVFNEAEAANKRELDDGELGPERKLYYRELIARFGHHLALEWNLCEEYNLQFDYGVQRIRAFARYIRAVDPMDHPITVHSAGDPLEMLAFTFGDPLFSLTSVQLNQRRIDVVTEALRSATAQSGRPLPISLDEFTVDTGTNKSHIPVDVADLHRKQKVWPTYFSGGMIEFILEGLLAVDSFKTPEREALWRYVWYARKFMQDNLPFWEMQPDDALVRGAATIEVGIGRGRTTALGAQVFTKPGHVYAIYLPRATPSGQLDLSAVSATFGKRWYNPRTGDFEGDTMLVKGGEAVPLGSPPRDPQQDWVVLLRLSDATSADPAPSEARRRDVFPADSWATKPAAALGLDDDKLDLLAKMLGGRGCVIKNGYVVKAWGSQSRKGDWYSSAKPVLSTLLLFAVHEGRVQSVDARLSDFGWSLREKDRSMTFRHLATMTSGYARPEPPGQAWAYNDYAIQLYQTTLFDRVFQDDPETVANHPQRFGRLQLEDGLSFRAKNRRLSASVRDFARIAWFWLNQGTWNGTPVLPRRYFTEFMKPHVAKDTPHTAKAATDDYLGIGTFGGGSDHFTRFGAGVYGFNCWFNTTGRLHPDRPTWPDAPAETIMTLGVRGNCSVWLPSARAVLVAADANWGKLEAGSADARMNRVVAAFAESVSPAP